jgi:hypothetical protein
VNSNHPGERIPVKINPGIILAIPNDFPPEMPGSRVARLGKSTRPYSKSTWAEILLALC